ncbi:PssE/Cps14G family polysaccharide biosynthesis glycosyltransferase [Bacillus sp. JJ1521]|uniref:PssE/Cps14G family polysaccharide biosynthesis glycosyltransferase n=1 Tax=Bacillus sp. JJ1521 TaxID=3122957 RepID=UPI002FFFD97D
MIFVTVGTQKFQFNRLFQKLDELKQENKIQDEIISQIGYSTYKPKHYKHYEMLSSKEVSTFLSDSEICICHAGTSSIIQALKYEKKVIVVPRKKEFGEHVDNHQEEIASMFYDLGFIEVVDNIDNLVNIIGLVREKEFNQYNFDNRSLLSSIRNDIDGFIK